MLQGLGNVLRCQITLRSSYFKRHNASVTSDFSLVVLLKDNEVTCIIFKSRIIKQSLITTTDQHLASIA